MKDYKEKPEFYEKKKSSDIGYYIIALSLTHSLMYVLFHSLESSSGIY